MSAAPSGVSGRSAAMVTDMAGNLRWSLVACGWPGLGHELPLGSVAGKIAGSKPCERESTNEHDDAHVQECQSPAERRHAAGSVENPSDHNRPHEAARVAGHRVKRQGGAPARWICAARGPGSQRGGVEPDQESIGEDQYRGQRVRPWTEKPDDG